MTINIYSKSPHSGGADSTTEWGGVNLDYKLAGDFDLWMKFSRSEKLYVVNALIGGFRVNNGQLSMDVERYCDESNQIIASEPISEIEKQEIRRIRWMSRLVAVAKQLRILNWQALENRLFQNLKKEEREHRLHFDFMRKEFVC